MMVRARRLIPRRDWRRIRGVTGVLLERDLKVSAGSRLRAKLLVFGTTAALRQFWRRGLGRGELGRSCCGAVTPLGYEVQDFRKDGTIKSRRMEVDSRYFCVIGLCEKHLSMEIISHEAVHAGYAYAKRVNLKNLWYGAKENDEELVCYPAGRIAAEINRKLHKAGLYK